MCSLKVLRASAFRQLNGGIWAPPHLLALRSWATSVGLLTYIRPLLDLDLSRSGHDGLFARQLPIGNSGFSPTAVLGFC